MSIRSRGAEGDRATRQDEAAAGPERTRRSHRDKGLERAAVAAVADRLAALRSHELDQLGLDDDLREAVAELNALEGSARGRQAKFLNGLLRHSDLEELTRKLDRGEGSSYVAQARQADAPEAPVETWLARLLADGDAAVNDLVEARPAADRQQLRQLIRTALKTPPSSTTRRALRSLRSVVEELIG